jgi:DNA polymerase-3 subunit alpha
VRWAKEHQIVVGPGRGSGAGSVVGWSLKITNIDPIRYSLIFERFLNPERVSVPDFDIDFCQNRRDEVVDYVLKKYGKSRVAHIIAIGSLQARAVLRDVGRVIQMPYPLVDRICKLVPHNPVHPIDLGTALEIEPQLRSMMEKDESVEFLVNTGLKLEGMYRHSSMHAAGIVICDKPIDEIVPLYSEEGCNLSITQFNMKYVELAGLVKFDFLGLKTLTVINDACDNIKKYRDIDLDMTKIDLEDKKTFDLLSSVNVVGVFQLESTGMKDVIEKLRPDRLEDIIALISLYRPGPMDDIPRYLARKHGKEKIEYLHPLLVQCLESTYGVMVYQEQVLKIAQIIGGYTLASADILRKAMGKKIKKEMNKQKKIFLNGAKNNGISEEVASKIFTQMEKFAGYGFNRSHAAPYALLSYQTAFLKANYRREFYIAILNIDIDNMEKIYSYINDAKKAGIPIFPPDINKSETMFSAEEDGIRYGLAAIKGLGIYYLNKLINVRNQNGPFRNIQDFIRRARESGLNKKYYEVLTLSGAFDSIHNNRCQLFKSVDRILQSKKSSDVVQFSLFGEKSDEDVVFIDSNEWSSLQKLENERLVLGFYLTSHPIESYKEFLWDVQITEKRDFTGKMSEVVLAVVLLSKKEKLSKSRQKYAFLEVSDPSGAFEVVVFQDLYSKVSQLMQIGTAFIISACIKTDADNPKLVANEINTIDSFLKKQKVYLLINDNSDIDCLYKTIESIEDGDNHISFIVQKSTSKKVEITTKYRKNLTIENKQKLSSVRGVRFYSGGFDSFR